MAEWTEIDLNSKSKSGIYKLIDGNGEVVYVGQSKNVMQRVSSHHDKSFLKAFWTPVEPEKLDITEKHFIVHYNPKLNREAFTLPFIGKFVARGRGVNPAYVIKKRKRRSPHDRTLEPRQV